MPRWPSLLTCEKGISKYRARERAESFFKNYQVKLVSSKNRLYMVHAKALKQYFLIP